MFEFRSFQMFVILMIPFTAVTQHRSSITVRVGDETTLPCEEEYQDKCLSPTWIFNYIKTGPTVTLFEHGQIHREAASKSDRLRVTEKCCLVIKKVTYEDVGRYVCRETISEQTVTYSDVNLIVTDRDNGPTTRTRTTTIKLPTTTKRTTEAAKPAAATTKTSTKVTKATTRPTTTTTDPAAGEMSPTAAILIPVGVVLAALLIIIVAVIRWKRPKGNNTQVDDNNADPPDGVFYASIRYKKKTKSKARVQGEDDTVTYSTLNTSSTSAGASTDRRNLYASINKTKA